MISDKLDGSSQILTKEEDLSNKESVLKKRKELEELQRNLYNKMDILEKKYTELFKTDLINRNIKDKCFVSNKILIEFMTQDKMKLTLNMLNILE